MLLVSLLLFLALFGTLALPGRLLLQHQLMFVERVKLQTSTAEDHVHRCPESDQDSVSFILAVMCKGLQAQHAASPDLCSCVHLSCTTSQLMVLIMSSGSLRHAMIQN